MNLVVVDNDPLVLKSMEGVLADLGLAAQSFLDPVRAIEWIREHGADIVISDICMPQLDGFQVLKRVKEISPGTDLIFITAHGQMDTAIRALREGAADFFTKPFTTDDMQAAIERTQRYRALTRQQRVLTDQLSLLSSQVSNRGSAQVVMLGRSEAMKRLASDIVDVAAANATVLVTGESGTGKELVARAIHQASPRARKPFLTVNCPSIPADLFESEMFGHRRGAYTGAVETRGGYIEAAAGGTIFLDEIGDLPLSSQAKILRLLEQKTYMPVGEHEERTCDVRVIAATNQPLLDKVGRKEFREDLYYRLSVCTMAVPPLRERREDVPLLALYFLLHFAGETGKKLEGIDAAAIGKLVRYDYPGNVRELRNVLESSVIRCKHDGNLQPADLPDLAEGRRAAGESGRHAPAGSSRFEEVERQLYEDTLAHTGANISEAARVLGLSRGKLRRRLAVLGLHGAGDEGRNPEPGEKA